MAKIKGWTKKWKTGERIRWDNTTNRNSIIVQQNPKKTRWNVVIYNDISNVILNYFQTKAQAMDYATRYMKTHPIG